QQEIKSADYLDAFKSQMKEAGFKVDGDSDNIFENSPATSDMQIGGIINDINLNYCVQGTSLNSVHGQAIIHVQWQIYSSIGKTRRRRWPGRLATQWLPWS